MLQSKIIKKNNKSIRIKPEKRCFCQTYHEFAQLEIQLTLLTTMQPEDDSEEAQSLPHFHFASTNISL